MAQVARVMHNEEIMVNGEYNILFYFVSLCDKNSI